MPSLQSFIFSLASIIALADAQVYNTTMTNENVSYQIGVWSSIVLLFALLYTIKTLGSIDYSNDILIICNTGEKEQ